MRLLAASPIALLALAVAACEATAPHESGSTGAGAEGGTGGAPDASGPTSSSGGCVPAPGCTCCGEQCLDLATDPAHCGACDVSCASKPNAAPACALGACALGPCVSGWSNCNGVPDDGCESSVSCVCAPGAVQACYTGPPGTEGVGACVGGTTTCAPDGLGWGPCAGEVLPVPEACGLADTDCDGTAGGVDVDGDGWTPCTGDCCELPACAPEPEKVNPGALEIVGNGIDDDCDAASSDVLPVPDCGGNPLMVPTSSTELIKAMDLCQFITGNEPIGPTKKWGVISSELLQADGTPVAPLDVQRGVLGSYGVLLPKKGATLAATSTGAARAEGDSGWLQPQDGPMPGEIGGFDAGTTSAAPPAFVAPYAGILPPPSAASGCPACSGAACTTVHDSVNLKVKIRTPTNSSTLHFQYAFFTSEYPERFCAQADDRFVALLTGQAIGIPPDTNIAFDALGHAVSVNDGFFPICTPIAGPPWATCPSGPADLVGTGMGGWSGALDSGAGMPWTTVTAPFVPGEDIVLEWIVWDGGDYDNDSIVLLDAFEW